MSEVNKEKLKALQLTIDKLEKSYGKGSIMKLGDRAAMDIDVIPTGSLTMDLAIVMVCMNIPTGIRLINNKVNDSYDMAT